MLALLLVWPAGVASADTRCWIQPGAHVGWVLRIAGMPIPITPEDRGPDVSPDGTVGHRWCAVVPASGVYEWNVAAVGAGAQVWSTNGPLVTCWGDQNRNGAVDLGDVQLLLSRLGEVCGDPD